MFSSSEGPKIYFKKQVYRLHDKLDIRLKDYGGDSIFEIVDYGIKIQYSESKYMNWDSWSGRKDLDLFYRIEQSYKDAEFYKRYTK